MQRRGRWIAWIAAGLGVALVATLVAGWLVLRRWESTEGQEWAVSFESMHDLVASFPPTGDSQAACAGLTWTVAKEADGDIRIAAPTSAFHDPARAPSFSCSTGPSSV